MELTSPQSIRTALESTGRLADEEPATRWGARGTGHSPIVFAEVLEASGRA